MSDPLVSRRSLLRGSLLTVAAGIAGYAVASNTSAAKGSRGGSQANAYGPSAGSGGHLLAQVAQIPVGGGVVLASKHVVLSRGSDGRVHGFSAICTHQGCTVGSVDNGVIVCPCHGSRFDAFTGAVVSGPAPSPLPAVQVTVQNGGVYTA